MSFSKETQNKVFDKYGGRCALCGKQLVRKNYGVRVGRGRWQIDHSKPDAKGGTDHINNLLPMCAECNNRKSDMTLAQAKKKFGQSRKKRS